MISAFCFGDVTELYLSVYCFLSFVSTKLRWSDHPSIWQVAARRDLVDVSSGYSLMSL